MIYENHPSVAKLYPDVVRIVLFIAFEEADSESEPNYQQVIFTPDAAAAFRLDCSREGCVGGGFDFAPVIDVMVRNEESRVHGRLNCEGTLGATGHRCNLKAEYRIVID